MRRFLSFIAFWLSEQNLKRAEAADTFSDELRYGARSEFWSDVEAWISGLGSWRRLRNSHRRQAGKG